MSCGFCWPYFLSDSRWIQINITLIDFCPEAARFFRWLFNLLWLTGCTKNWLFSPSFRVELNTHNEIPSECSGRIRKSYGGRSIFSWDYCTKNGKNLAKQLVCECVNVFAWFNSSPSNRQTEWHRCAWIRTMIAAGCNFNEWYFLPVTMCTECVRSFRVLIFFSPILHYCIDCTKPLYCLDLCDITHTHTHSPKSKRMKTCFCYVLAFDVCWTHCWMFMPIHNTENNVKTKRRDAKEKESLSFGHLIEENEQRIETERQSEHECRIRMILSMEN